MQKARDHRAMKIAKAQQPTKQITIRVPLELYAQLEKDAAAQVWTVNAEINHRLRAGPIVDQLRALTAEVDRLRGIVEKNMPE